MENIYEKYNLKPVINASGKMTILGVSTVSKEVIESLNEGANHFFEIKKLLDNTGNYIANLLNVEGALVVSSASAGIAMSVASLITKDNLFGILNLHKYKNKVANEIVIAKGHNVNYGAPVETMIELGGGTIVEAGYANECTPEQIETMINENTAGILYIKSHHCVQKSIASLEDFVKIAKKHKLPLIVDAAAEEDLTKYYKIGADLVIYSGAKAIEGPTSGLVIGKKHYIDMLKLQGQGIGRAMKVGKENILGFTKAIEIYVNRQDGELIISNMKEKVTKLNDLVNKLPNVKAVMVQDSSGREIYRSLLSFDIDAKKVAAELKSGDVAIYTRDYQTNNGKIEVDLRSVSEEEVMIIYNRLKEILK